MPNWNQYTISSLLFQRTNWFGIHASTTDDLLKTGHMGKVFEELFFQYGRYLLIALLDCSDALPANLQGVWNAVDNFLNSDYQFEYQSADELYY